MDKPVQLTLLDADLPHRREFDAWHDTVGGRHILRDFFLMASRYHRRQQRTGQRVSMKLLWERERDHIRDVRYRFRVRYGERMPKTYGYALNNNLHAYVARFILQRRPEWVGLFEQREVGASIRKRRVVFVNVTEDQHGCAVQG